MEMLYYVQKKHMPSGNLPAYNIPIISKISSCNILAFTTSNDLHDATNSGWGSYVYVCDITAPWHIFKVTSNKHYITVLEWDITGRHLLLGDSEGNVQIWTQKDYLLSEWIQLYAVHFFGERIIKAVFFHNGRKIMFPPEKREMILYAEKFQRNKFSPSVRQFGGVPAEGCLIITATGLVGAFLIPTEQPSIGQNNGFVNGQNTTQVQYAGPYKLIPVTESLGPIRNYLTTAAISYGKNPNYFDGHFCIAVANGESKNETSAMVQCFRAVVKVVDNKLVVTSHSLPSFFLYEGAGRDLPDMKITHLCWTANEDADSLIVVAKSSIGSFVELWSLVELITPIHKLLQTNKSEVFKTIVWSNQNSFRQSSLIMDICISKVVFENSYIYITMADNSVQILVKDFKRVANFNVSSVHMFESDHSSKQPKVGIQLAAHDITHMGHMIIAVDKYGQIYGLKIPQIYQEQSGNQSSLISHTVSLLEYCVVTGYDASDVFVSIRPNMLESVIERLTENFTRQPSLIQQYYYVNLLTMKTNLYRMLISGQSKANDLISLLMLHSILTAFKSLLRPSDLTSHDKGPAENLAMVLSESVADVDKVMVNLDAKDFTVESSTLQSLQQLVQWVADLALTILAKLPNNRMQGGSKNMGVNYDISKDIVALNSIRELLVMIRIWGLVNTLCLPVFLKSVETLDVLATLFNLLTRLALNPTEPDEHLLDECCLLPNQVLIPHLQFVSPFTSITSPLLHLNAHPIPLTFHTEPECLKFWPDISTIEGGLTNDGFVDSVGNLLLGKNPIYVRKCLRCGTCSSVGSVAKTAAMKAWELRWANNCRCGGFWVLQKTNKQTIVKTKP